nr:MAG TPA: hypothetical protein [Caudoviricetes sp.]
MKKKDFLMPAILIVIAVVIIFIMTLLVKREQYRRKIEHLQSQIEILNSWNVYPSVVYDTIHDTVPVASAPALVVTKEEYKKVTDKALLKDLNVKPAAITSQLQTEISTRDSIKLRAAPKDNDYIYHDQWTDIHLSLKDSMLRYDMRDSIAMFIVRDYKHRFLFWRWGTKGYNVKLVNFNPRATIKYLKYVKVE